MSTRPAIAFVFQISRVAERRQNLAHSASCAAKAKKQIPSPSGAAHPQICPFILKHCSDAMLPGG